MGLRDAVKRWWKGDTSMHAFDHRPGAGSHFYPAFPDRRHWTAKAAGGLVKFWLNHWQWIIGTCIALVGLYVTFRRFGIL